MRNRGYLGNLGGWIPVDFGGAPLRRFAVSELAADLADLAQMNIQTVVRAMNALSPTADNAQKLVDQGIRALDLADTFADKAADQPGEQAQRDTVRGHLQFYNSNPDQLASGFADIRDWATQAMVKYNAVAEVANQAIFWPSVLEALKELPSTIGNAVGSVLAGAGNVAGMGIFGLLKGLASSPLGLAVIGAAALILLRKRGRAT